MAKKNFIKKEDVLKALKSQIKELSNESNKDIVERGFFAECLVQIEKMEEKAEIYDAILWAINCGWSFGDGSMPNEDDLIELVKAYKKDLELTKAYESDGYC